MSRYDRDESPDEIRDSEVHRPTESSRRQETSDAKGQGGGSGTSQDKPPRHEIRPGKVRSVHQGRRTKHPDLDRDRTYSLRDSELKTLTDIGTFRVLRLDDLVSHRYGGDPAEAIRQHHDRLLFLHLKDLDASNRFVELGRGRVNFKAVFAALDAIGFDGWGVVELDSVPDAARTPKQSGAIARHYLETEGRWNDAS